VDGEIVARVERRRQWTLEEKAALMAEVEAAGGQVSAVARRHGITPNLLFRWRKAAQIEAKPTAPAFLPVSVSAPTKSGETGCDRNDSEAPAADNRIEIELLNGRRVRVGPGVDMGALKRILDIAEGRRS